jgi:hypothetical protein
VVALKTYVSTASKYVSMKKFNMKKMSPSDMSGGPSPLIILSLSGEA